MSAPHVKVGEHAGVVLYLDPSDGRFYAKLKDAPAGDVVSANTLDGLKKKLANIARASSREEAVSLPAVALVQGGRWGDDHDVLPKWYVGTFAGINAHTGEISFQVDGKIEKLSEYTRLFRAGDSAIEDVKRLLAERARAAKASKAATDAAEKAMEQHSFRVSLRYSRDKTAEAQRVETALIDFLTPKEAK